MGCCEKRLAWGLVFLWLVSADAAVAQTFKTLASFDAETSGNSPVAPLAVGSDLNLYGTTAHYGANNTGGTLFEVTAAGALTTLHSFCSLRASNENCTDGQTPSAPLVLAANGKFYGTTYYGGITDHGVIFSFTPPSTPRAVTPSAVYSFCVQADCPDGSNPAAGLVEDGNGIFYGTTTTGGYVNNDGGDGTVFKFTAGSATLDALFTFCIGEGVCSQGDNYDSSAGLVMGSDGNLYGTTPSGGPEADDEGSAGIVFQIIPSTGAFQVKYDFCNQASCPTGLNPSQTLVKGTDGFLYGTTPSGGANGAGTVFKMSTSGAVTTLYNFTPCAQAPCTDGAGPTGALIQATDGNFYGVTNTGGANNLGTVYRMTPAGTLTTVYSFCNQVDSHTGYCRDGQNPLGGLVQTANRKIYGTTSAGGTSNDGTVFRLLLFPGAGADSVAKGAQTDYQGEGQADYTVWRPSNGYWYSNDGGGMISSIQWGASTDRPVVGDFDGDGKSDVAVWRPSTGFWYIVRSSDGVVVRQQWGAATDIPVAGDFDGDDKTDIAVWRPSNGFWYIVQSSNGTWFSKQWGAATDIPVTGDFDGDGKTDIAVWRPSTGYWYIVQSSNGAVVSKPWGESTDTPVPGDFDGDGKTDIAVWRPSTGYWYIVQSSNGEVISQQWGESGDIPVARDYDGDGKTDIAVFRPSTGSWYVIQSSTGQQVTEQWGASSDVPANNVPR